MAWSRRIFLPCHQPRRSVGISQVCKPCWRPSRRRRMLPDRQISPPGISQQPSRSPLRKWGVFCCVRVTIGQLLAIQRRPLFHFEFHQVWPRTETGRWAESFSDASPGRECTESRGRCGHSCKAPLRGTDRIAEPGSSTVAPVRQESRLTPESRLSRLGLRPHSASVFPAAPACVHELEQCTRWPSARESLRQTEHRGRVPDSHVLLRPADSPSLSRRSLEGQGLGLVDCMLISACMPLQALWQWRCPPRQ